jgi:hypothetical protein
LSDRPLALFGLSDDPPTFEDEDGEETALVVFPRLPPLLSPPRPLPLPPPPLLLLVLESPPLPPEPPPVSTVLGGGVAEVVAVGGGCSDAPSSLAARAEAPPARSPPPPAFAPDDPEEDGPLDASWPDASGTGLPSPLEAPFAAACSSTFSMDESPRAEGQTLNETRPTRVMKRMAAPARSAPDAPTPTIRLSGVLFDDVLAAE